MPRAVTRIATATAQNDANNGSHVRSWVVPAPIATSTAYCGRLRSFTRNDRRNSRRDRGVSDRVRLRGWNGLFLYCNRHRHRLYRHRISAFLHHLDRLRIPYRSRCAHLLDRGNEPNRLIALRGVREILGAGLCRLKGSGGLGFARVSRLGRRAAGNGRNHQGDSRDEIPYHRVSRVRPALELCSQSFPLAIPNNYAPLPITSVRRSPDSRSCARLFHGGREK